MDTIPVLVVGSALACMAIIGCNDKARGTSQQNACINNLRQIEAAKEQWFLEVAGKNETTVVSEVNAFIKGGQPQCPAKGRYTYNQTETDATCSLAAEGHALP